MVNRHHKDLLAWQKARRLAGTIYRVSTQFPDDEQFGLTSQCRRASISVLSNISEGAGRGSDKEFRQFLYVARGSVAELEAQLLVAADLDFLATEDPVFAEIAEVGRLVNGLTNTLNRALTQSALPGSRKSLWISR
jgi:four helix bundle protein